MPLKRIVSWNYVQNKRYLDHDIIEILNNFVERAQNKSINIKLISEKGVVDNPSDYNAIFYSKTQNES